MVTSRRFHAHELRRLTGLEVGEGQARILLNDLRAYQGELERSAPGSAPERVAAARWVETVFRPGAAGAVAALGPGTDPVQAYCDLLEVRWLLSEDAGFDVGDEVALAVLLERTAPPESAAVMALAEAPLEASAAEAAIEADWRTTSPPIGAGPARTSE